MDDTTRRDQAYAELFGAEWESFPDDTGESQIEVRRVRAAPMPDRRVCDIWFTSGMSDIAMLDDDGDPFRRELVFYAEPGGDYAMALRAVARFPLEHETSLDHGHTLRLYGAFFVPGGADALAHDRLTAISLPHLVLLAPLVREHQRLNEELTIAGCPVDFLWVVPISAAEHALKTGQGIDALLDVFEARQHPWLFDARRRSYVG
jgi:hypothetical protein